MVQINGKKPTQRAIEPRAPQTAANWQKEKLAAEKELASAKQRQAEDIKRLALEAADKVRKAVSPIVRAPHFWPDFRNIRACDGGAC